MPGQEFSPHSLRAEMHLLGAIILNGCGMDGENEAMDWASKQIAARDFYDARNRQIFWVMFKLYTEKNPIDQVTLYHELVALKQWNPKGGLGDEYLANLVACVENPFNYRYCGAWIKRLAEQRQAIIDGTKAVQDAVEGRGKKKGFEGFDV